MSELRDKFREVLLSVLPVTLIVLVLHFTISPLGEGRLPAFLIGSVFIIVGLTIFLFGIDQGLEPIGHGIGNAVTRSNRYAVVITVSLVIGFCISYAEPDLHILARQVNRVTSGQFGAALMVAAVSVGIGVMMTVGMLRILENIRLRYVLTGAYGLILILSLFSSPDFLAIAFDASGATTGAVTVPFMLSLSSGISAMKKDSRLSEADSFGVIGISSTGAVIGVLTAGLFFRESALTGTWPQEAAAPTGLWEAFAAKAGHVMYDAFVTLVPILIIYAVLQIFLWKQKKERVFDILRGIALTFVGLVLFLLGVNGGFMAVGAQIGMQLAAMNSAAPMLLLALMLGISTVLAEPAVHVLTDQVEEITGGSVGRGLVLLFLSMAVGLAVFLSSLRILIPGIQLWMYLLPGFGLAVALSYVVPDLFVGMAIDAGGVASGPMTATFSLAFVQGVAERIPTADVVTDGFGMIAVVAMVPILAIEFLGILYQMKLRTAAAASSLREKKSEGRHG